MENVYSQSEKVDMLLIYGECKKNSVQAAALYARRYPDRNHPNRRHFSKVEGYLRRAPNNADEKFIISENIEIDVLAYVAVDHTASTREIAHHAAISHQSVWKILKKHKYKSFKYQLHQHLYEGDGVRRVHFCNWLLGKYAEDRDFHKNILFSDESRFTNNGIFNRNNCRYWAEENPHLVREGNFQERFGFNVWAGIKNNMIIGPIIFDGHLTGERYLEFLQNEIGQVLDNNLNVNEERLYFQQDGAPPHNSRIVADYLNNRFGEHWIGTNGPVRWPPRSPDLTCIDFFLWPHLKNIVYSTAVYTREDLENRVRMAFNNITPEQLQNVQQNVIKRVRLCRDQNGGHFEQLLDFR